MKAYLVQVHFFNGRYWEQPITVRPHGSSAAVAAARGISEATKKRRSSQMHLHRIEKVRAEVEVLTMIAALPIEKAS